MAKSGKKKKPWRILLRKWRRSNKKNASDKSHLLENVGSRDLTGVCEHDDLSHKDVPSFTDMRLDNGTKDAANTEIISSQKTSQFGLHSNVENDANGLQDVPTSDSSSFISEYSRIHPSPEDRSSIPTGSNLVDADIHTDNANKPLHDIVPVLNKSIMNNANAVAEDIRESSTIHTTVDTCENGDCNSNKIHKENLVCSECQRYREENVNQGPCVHFADLDIIIEEKFNKTSGIKNNDKQKKKISQRTWKACKRSWKYFKTGLAFYANATVTIFSFSSVAATQNKGSDERGKTFYKYT